MFVFDSHNLVNIQSVNYNTSFIAIIFGHIVTTFEIHKLIIFYAMFCMCKLVIFKLYPRVAIYYFWFWINYTNGSITIWFCSFYAVFEFHGYFIREAIMYIDIIVVIMSKCMGSEPVIMDVVSCVCYVLCYCKVWSTKSDGAISRYFIYILAGLVTHSYL